LKQLLIGLAALLATDCSLAQISVVPPTGIPARFPKANSELSKQTKPPSRNWLRDADDDRERFRRIELWSGAGDLEMQDIAHRFVELHAALTVNHVAEKIDFLNTSAVFVRTATFP
jgi:hypothetical protein